jgi:hypothetical protein
MPIPEAVWVPAVSALSGALIGSISPVVAGLLNSRAEARRERLRLAVQLALYDHKHLMEDARVKAKAGARVGVPPVSAVLAYHAEVLETFEASGELTPEDFLRLGKGNKAVFDALAADTKAAP